MTTAPQLVAHAPVLMVSDIARSVDYWTTRIGFSSQGIYGEPPDFAILERDGARLMLSLAPEGHEILPLWKIRGNMWNCYFWVDDAARLYDEFVKRGAIIDYELGEKPYGVLEFGIRDLDEQDIGFGQVLNRRNADA